MLPVLLNNFQNLVDLHAAEPTRSFENDLGRAKAWRPFSRASHECVAVRFDPTTRRKTGIQRSQHGGHSVAILSHRCETTLWGGVRGFRLTATPLGPSGAARRHASLSTFSRPPS